MSHFERSFRDFWIPVILGTNGPSEELISARSLIADGGRLVSGDCDQKIEDFYLTPRSAKEAIQASKVWKY